MLRHIIAAPAIPPKKTIAKVAIIREHICGTRLPDGLPHRCTQCIQLRSDCLRGPIGITQQHLRCDWPESFAAKYIVLHECKGCQLTAGARPRHVHLRHASMSDPHIRPFVERLPGDRLERSNQVAPLCVSVWVRREISLQTLAEVIVAEPKCQLLQHAR